MKNFTSLCLFLFATFCLAQSSPSNSTANLGKGSSNGENSNVLVCSSELSYYNPDGFGPYWCLLKVHAGYYPGQNLDAANYEVRIYAHPICTDPVVNWFYMGKVDTVVGLSLSGDVQTYGTSAYGELELSVIGYIIYCEVWDKPNNTKVNETTFLAVSQ